MAVKAPPYRLERLGIVMEPLPGEPREVEGVLNPATARARDGELYLFPRMVARGNYSRIGRARVVFDQGGKPSGVERLGIALEPDEAWERNPATAGVEDPRITFVDSLDAYVMAYAAYGPLGPRIGLAISRDLLSWERMGPVSFDYQPSLRTDLNLYPNKDAMFFPKAVPGPDGKPAYAMLHRPMWNLSWISPNAGRPLPVGVTDERQSIWVSFAPAEAVMNDLHALTRLGQHRQVAQPQQPWEATKIGGGTPPIRIPEGWLIIYHGVTARMDAHPGPRDPVRYVAGAMVLDPQDVSRVLSRSQLPLLEPETKEEREGTVPNVVFPTAIDVRDGGEADVYYGMADTRIGAARLRRIT
ncbi:MAG TPA: glycosidase [Candidatus Dormibacteraeota bacterium]|nr:glycosidase [Candidatus Dormibacteraeota bacterium]